MSILTIIIFVVIFSILILVHELGHFWVAKKAGVKVEEFGIGLPPRIWGVKKKNTIYSVNWIPFGGFVRVKGEGGENLEDKDSLKSRSYPVQILFTIGGVLMNFATAYIVLVIGFWLGMPPMATDVTAYVTDQERITSQILVLHVDKESPAEVAGIQSGDLILEVDGMALSTVEDLQQALAGKRLASLLLQRDGEALQVTSATIFEENRQIIGVLADELVERVNYVWWQVPLLALQELWNLLRAIAIAIVGILAKLVTTASVPESIAGPVGIAKITAQVVRLGFLSVLQFIIFLSVNLGLINIVPFPALDGGRLVFLIAEVCRGGKRIKPVVENAIHSIGFLLLLAFIFVVTYRDILKFF